MSSCNKAIIRWMDEETTGIHTIHIFISFVAGVLNSSLSCIFILLKRKQIVVFLSHSYVYNINVSLLQDKEK